MYLKNGLGYPNSYKMWFSTAELLPGTVCFLAYKNDMVVGSISSIADSKVGLPVDLVNESKINEFRSRKFQLAEVYSLAIDTSQKEADKILAKLIELTFTYNYYIRNASHHVITVVPKHSEFYCRMLCFEDVGIDGYHKKTGVECRLLVQSLDNMAKLSENGNVPTYFKNFSPHDQMVHTLDTARECFCPPDKTEITYWNSIRPIAELSGSHLQKEFLQQQINK